MSVPGRLDQGNELTRTEEVSIVNRDLEPKQAAPAAVSTRPASDHFPRSLVVLLAMMFVMCGASVVVSMLAMQGKIGCGECSCPCVDGLAAERVQTKEISAELQTLKEEAKRMAEQRVNDRHDFDALKNSTRQLDVIANATIAWKTKMNQKFQSLLNLTLEQAEKLREQMWKSANETVTDLNRMNETLRKTEHVLAQLKQVTADLNSTKEEIRELNETTRNFTKEAGARSAIVRAEAVLAQQLFSNQSATLTQLSEKVINISRMPGPVGPPGYNESRGFNGSQGPAGPPGPEGAGDFSQCLYKSAKESNESSRTDVEVNEPSDKRIVGATCSTLDDAAEYRLSSQIKPSGERQYKCDCAGKSSKMTCFIHYWECPLIT